MTHILVYPVNNLLLNEQDKRDGDGLEEEESRPCSTTHTVDGICVERVSSFRFLRVHVMNYLRWLQWSANHSSRLQFLRLLNKCHLEVNLLHTVHYPAPQWKVCWCTALQSGKLAAWPKTEQPSRGP